jgi:hypothetical protein
MLEEYKEVFQVLYEIVDIITFVGVIIITLLTFCFSLVWLNCIGPQGSLILRCFGDKDDITEEAEIMIIIGCSIVFLFFILKFFIDVFFLGNGCGEL